jgi:NADPH-dependent curcumin reductase CurA
MSEITNRQWLLQSRPKGAELRAEDFRFAEAPLPEPGEGELLVRNLMLSCEPAQLTWLMGDSYVPAVQVGEVVRSLAAAQVVRSRDPAFRAGQLLSGWFGWQDYALARRDGLYPITPLRENVPVENALSILGTTGLTAYFGLHEVGRPKAGETLLVSAAAGATGALVGQLGKLHGCRVVGIAGGPEKCRQLVEELGFDAAIDYKGENLMTRLRQTCANGVDIYFDNVGGRTLDAVLLYLALRGRVVLCGALASYGEGAAAQGPRNYLRLLRQRGRMEGFVVLDFMERAEQALGELEALWRGGKLKDRVDLQHGLEQAPAALARLFRGENRGKQLIKLADPSG